IEPMILPLMQSASWQGLQGLDAAPFDGLRDVAFKGLSYAAYAAAGQSGYAGDHARAIAQLMRENVAPQWQAAVRAHVEKVQQETQMLIWGSYALYGVILLLLAYQSAMMVIPALGEIARQREQLRNLAATDM